MAQEMPSGFPYSHFPLSAGCSPVFPLSADRNRCHDVKGLGENAILDGSIGQAGILHLNSLQVHAAQRQMSQIKPSQITPQQS